MPSRRCWNPSGANTAPAIALAAAWLSRGGDDPVLVVLPADHVIRDRPAFHDALRRAVEAAEAGALVTFGIRPTAPETGYGYIQAVTDGTAVAPVQRFTEKPDLATAEGFLAAGNYWWNSGMFVWRASSILAEVERHLPEVHAVLQRIRGDWDASETADPQPAVEAHFAAMPSISIDYGVLERSDRVRLVPCDIGWSDVGSWDAVHDLAELDDRGNALHGNALAIDCDNTLLHGNGRLVAAVGVRDLCVVETADAILIAPRGQTQRVREVVDELSRRDASECRLHRTVQRPWGSYTVLEESPGYKMKRIAVSPGASLSLQRHQHRSEHWIVVSGTATVTRGEEVFTVAPNESTYISITLFRMASFSLVASAMTAATVPPKAWAIRLVFMRETLMLPSLASYTDTRQGIIEVTTLARSSDRILPAWCGWQSSSTATRSTV
jgi:mannose-1-phosphate guanylyltransferase / mannose-6-phosphate isomerase